MEFVDKAFARRLEATEEVPQVHHARLYQKLYPEVSAAAEEISSRSFFPEGNPPEEFHRWIGPMYQYPGVVTLLAWADEKPVASAAGLIIADHDVFAMFGDATLPEFRRRGIQSALVQARLR